ncbi:hypothetical protein FACS189481_5170 [Clostridia bacterium]|nr:hypothetical protein FACS189481_5170 [Clostridia bacterium]
MKYKGTKNTVKRLVSVMLVAAVLSFYCFVGFCENKNALSSTQQAKSKKWDPKKDLEICLILAEIGVGLTVGSILLISLFYTATKHKRK